ncbi:MAG: hypothetical protein KDD60_09400, partial [Bdellovibrionales bacterium]|nr:hypothetical protein [Bdellovibrionales bacterium]
PRPLQIDREQHSWGCFLAIRESEKLQVCEIISDEFGNSWSDTSSWYWNAILSRTVGPWWATTVAEEIS